MELKYMTMVIDHHLIMDIHHPHHHIQDNDPLKFKK